MRRLSANSFCTSRSSSLMTERSSASEARIADKRVMSACTSASSSRIFCFSRPVSRWSCISRMALAWISERPNIDCSCVLATSRFPEALITAMISSM